MSRIKIAFGEFTPRKGHKYLGLVCANEREVGIKKHGEMTGEEVLHCPYAGKRLIQTPNINSATETQS